FDVHIRLLVAELSFEALFKLYRRERTYRQLPRYPVVERDLALIADEDVSANSLKLAIEESNLPLGVLVENVALFDVFRGETVPKGKKSMAYSFTLRSAERTLDEADIAGAITAILAALKSTGAVLRE
ncbi:MAG TPA: phenylalanine--tRNA ligase subunit beta, partial [Clostridia bacterium]|nr:phenylalanine--tRNA ligase subunit beta [Clostridia bacterium]